jgi:hypothetical protein
MHSVGVFCLYALVPLVGFTMCSAISFPRRKSSQGLFETFGVLCIALVLVLGTLRSIPLETFLPREPRQPVEEEVRPLEWWERTLPLRRIHDLPRKRLPA